MPTPLAWPDCRNTSDLGGLVAGASRIREGALIRSDSLHRLTPEGVDAVKAAGIRRILDLRGLDETAETEHPFAGDQEIYRNVPLIDPAREPDRNKTAAWTLCDIYKSSIVRNARSIVEGLRVIANAPDDGGVLVHCAVGKDRTGMTVALALTLTGVSDELIADDYFATAAYLQKEFDAVLAGITDPAQRERLSDRMGCKASTILETLAHTRSTFGSAEEYVLAHGMSKVELERLRERLVE